MERAIDDIAWCIAGEKTVEATPPFVCDLSNAPLEHAYLFHSRRYLSFCIVFASRCGV